MNILLWILVSCKLCVCYQHTLLLSTPKDIRVVNNKLKRTTTVVKDLHDAFAIDYLYNDSLVCWTDHRAEKIDCIVQNNTFTGNRMTYVQNVVPKPEGLACDWLTRKLYWTDNESKRIEVVSLETKYRKVVYWEGFELPRGIAVDPLEGFLFWTDWGDPPKIERGSMDGDNSSRKVIIHGKNIFWPNGISLDVQNKKLYWVDGKHLFIEMADYNGDNRRKLLDDISTYPFAVTYSDQKLYWSDWKTNSIYSADIGGEDTPSRLIHYNGTPIIDVKVFNSSRQPYTKTPCETNNGGCSHLCLLSSTKAEKYSCACPIGIRLVDERNCASRMHNFILLAQRTELSIISLDTVDHTNMKINLRNVNHAMGIDYDPIEERVYWTDMDTQTINRAKLDGSQEQALIKTDLLTPDGIAVDWIARNIYWSDEISTTVEVFRLGTAYRKAIIFDDIERPRAVAVFPQKGWLFWSDWGEKKPKIERSDLDGSNRVILVEDDIKWPNGLALDFENKKLYWGDAKTDRIEMINMNGEERREVLLDNVPHVFGLAVLGDKLFWTDWQKRSLEAMNRNPPYNRTVLIDSLNDVMGIRSVCANSTLGTNPCAVHNGNCSQFCFNKPANKYVCACQIEFELDIDNRTCIKPHAFLMLHSENEVARMGMKNPSSYDIVPLQYTGSVSAIDFRVSDNRLYWINVKMKTINRGYINGSRAEKIIVYGIQFPETIAVDWVSLNLYWADSGSRRIEVTKLNGQFRKTLFWTNLNEPRNLVLVPHDGYMFFTDWDEESGSIVKAAMDGSSRKVIVTTYSQVNGMTFDFSQRFLYWTTGYNDEGQVELCDMDGRNRRMVASLGTVPFSIAQIKDNLLLSLGNTNSIIYLNKFNGSKIRTVQTRMNRISDFKISDQSRQTGWNKCVFKNGGCQNLCLVRPGSTQSSTDITCACPTHYVMKDGICYPPDNFLIFSQRNAMYRLTVNSTDCPDTSLSISGVKGVQAVEYEAATKNVYWIDEKISTIKRHDNTSTFMFLGGQEETDLKYIYDIALEPISRVIFWSCSVSDIINVTRLDSGLDIGCIFRAKSGEKPRNLAVHSTRGLLFWTDVGSNPRIVESRLNGDQLDVIDTNEQVVDALTVDISMDILYFTVSGTIYERNVATKKTRSFFDTGSRLISSLAAIQSFLYWVNNDTMRIERGSVSKSTLKDRMSVVEMAQVTDLIAVSAADDSSYLWHPCSIANNHGNCSHLCAASADDATKAECQCPLSYKMSSDRRSCYRQPECGVDQFTCLYTPSECFSKTWRCDGTVDCSDESDEDPEVCGKRGGADAVTQETLLKNESNAAAEENLVADNAAAIDNTSIFAIVALFAVLVASVGFIILHFVRRWQKKEDGEVDVAVLSPLTNAATYDYPQFGMAAKGANNIGHVVVTESASTSSYERGGHVTGVSSSASVIHCPLNPPPSPTTTVMYQDECDCMPYALSPFTATPCSTDVCDESDATMSFRTDEGFVSYRNENTFSYHARRPSETRSRHRHSKHHRQQPRREFHFESAPPPSPHSGWSDPPSPSSSPCPPPPTPVNSLPVE